MTMAIKIVIRLTLTVVVIVLSVFSFIYFSPRPPLTIDPDTAAPSTTVSFRYSTAAVMTVADKVCCRHQSAPAQTRGNFQGAVGR